MQSRIERSYLAWVSPEVFPSIEAYSEYAKQHGAIRRIPNVGTASELSKPGTVLFLAHGLRGTRSRVCGACCQMIECPECEGRGGTERAPCERCHNHGVIETGSGGAVEVDGVRWAYTRWIRLRRTPNHKFWETKHNVGKTVVCKICGGRGRIPFGAVFGAIVPTRIVFITAKPDSIDAQEMSAKHGFCVVTDKQAGEYWPGKGVARADEGLYAVGDTAGINGAEQTAEALVQALGGRAKAYGGYVALDEPIAQPDKLFIGIKRWQHPAIDTGVL